MKKLCFILWIFQHLDILTGALCVEFGSSIINFLPPVWCTHDPSVWGDCTALCIDWDLVWAALSYTLSQRMLYCLSIDAFSERGRLTVWVCSSAHYDGMLLVALEASVSSRIHPLGNSSRVYAIKNFSLTLFFPIIIITRVFYLPDWYGLL